MRTSLIATVFNEEETISNFLKSILCQTKVPDEVIIVDGGSTDATASIISDFLFSLRKQISSKQIIFKFIIKKGNRSIGRNEAIKIASNEIILCSDAGCVLDENWVRKIISPFENPKVDVVAGYYEGKARTIFQKCLIPYVLVMKDKINPAVFLPASRSMAFKRLVWEKAGGFSEEYSHNEDYVFAKKIKKIGAKIVFEKNATVYWEPRKTLKDTFVMFFRFAFGDSEAGIIRNKVLLMFVRYFFSFYLLFLSFIERSVTPLSIAAVSVLIYILWSIKKNYRYVNNAKAFLLLPILQFTSDFAVMLGTCMGLVRRINCSKILKVIAGNKGAIITIALYIICMLLLINWGIPNQNHPFNYFMDEWHQAQAVRFVFTQGSPNVPGAANGSMFHFLLSGLLLVPFVLPGIVDPFAIKSSIESIGIQQNLFHLLRLNTLAFGIMSIILIAHVAKKYFRLNTFLIGFLFVVNPIWLMLSNYFKYDIALIFWIILSFLFILEYSLRQNPIYFFLTAFFSGIALSVKVSALPLFPILLISYIVFTNNIKNHMKNLLIGIVIFILSFLIFGIPDLLLGKGSMNEYIYDNLVRAPNHASNYILGSNYINYLFFQGATTVFGYFLFFVTVIAAIFTIGYLFNNKLQNVINRRYFIVITSLFLFIFSLMFLKIEARGNRLLVLLPFMALLSGFFITKLTGLLRGYIRKIVVFIFIILFLFQTIESLSWVNLKLKEDLRQSSSDWIGNNIPSGSEIGIENIPIYQFLPDIILKDYYSRDKNIFLSSNYSYVVIDGKILKLPSYVILTNENIVKNYIVRSSKKDLLNILEKENYKRIYYVKQYSFPFNMLRSRLDYFMSGLIQEPTSISIYKKQKNIIPEI